MRRGAVIAGLALVAAAGLAGSLPTVPEPVIQPGYKPAPSSKDEQGLWLEMEEAEAQLRQSSLLVRDPDVNAYVRSVACRVAGPYCEDVRIYVVRNPGFNASMAPNGTMVVWTGLFTRVHSSDEIATILGHETAHFTRTHSIAKWRSMKTSMAAGQILSLGLGVLTGVYTGAGEGLASLSVLSFSRGQEQEADLLGARMLAQAGFDPHASYRIWDSLIEEEKRAVDKGDEGSALLRTHPDSEQRSKVLHEWALGTYGPETPGEVDEDFRAILTAHYRMLMDDQIDTNRYSRTEFLLERHASMGVDPGLVAYYRGEMYRQRGGDGDVARAREAYLASVATGHAVPEAYRNLGYIYTKSGDRVAARDNFTHYLADAPRADDREMIEFYLKDEGNP